uniref:HAT C-terminal dimerisation domain-containing protein n=1 Tax=Lactuca sativa TaxID=4236 RepID=A0A9R1V2B0_LACSA|nr:hypothetical protein LSAT_V11C700348550 [Lactuca sativa]
MNFPTIYSNAEKNKKSRKHFMKYMRSIWKYMMHQSEKLQRLQMDVEEMKCQKQHHSGQDGRLLGSLQKIQICRDQKKEGVYKNQGKNGMDSFKALEWWNVHKLKYRVLSNLAMDVLTIPISTVASAATFSAGGRKEEMPIEVLLPTGTHFVGLNLLQGRLTFEF